MKYRLRKVLAVFLAAAVSAGIFAAAAGTGSVHAEGSETNKGWSSVSPRVNQTYTVSLELGAEVFYGNYQTHYYTVDGRTAYCLEPLKAWLASGEYTAERLGTGNLRKGLYYVYGGPGYETFVKQHGYLGFSGKMVKDDEYCMSHCIVSYLYSGEDTAFTGLSGEQASLLKQKAGKICSMPEPPGYFNAFLFNKGGKGQVMGGTGKDLTGAVEIYKQSGRPDWTDGNSCYSLEGAEFGLFEPGADTPAYRVVTDANGYGRADNVRTGAYDVKEIKSPKGYTLDQTSHRITVEEASVCRYSCEDEARYYPAELILQKIDADTGESRAQGSASLSDAWFTVRFYPGYYDTDPAEAGIKAARTWVLKSDEKGRVLFSGNARVSGDDFFRNSDGENILPLGTVTIQETKAPRGYLLNNQVILSRVTESGAGATDTLFQIPEVEEQVIRGHIQLVKFREDINPEEDRKTPLEGIRFAITSKTTGETVVIETDENGYASTRQKSGEQETGKEETEKERDGLVYDTYTIRELNPPEGLKPVEDFEVTINREGETLYYILENKQIFSPVKLVKTDSTTGKTVPAAGAQFELLDEHKNPVTMTVHYPSGTDYDVFSTDDSGSFILPEKLPAGTYYFREIAAPEGYMINEELLEFQILEGHNWDEPLTVEFPDEPEMERICIKKTDAATGSGIEGVHFDILAKEDIVTPDGTVRLEAGEKAGTLITDADGAAWSEELFPGEYEITETRQAAGYMLPETPYNTLLEYREGEGMEVAIENHKSRITDTIAVWEGSGGKYAEAGEESVIADTVELDYLNKGEEYILKGVVTDAATGKPLVIDGKSVESEFRFTPQQPQTAVKMRFSADFSRLAGKRLVVYEYLYLREDLLSSHEDIKDEDQTVEILNQEEPAVKTGDNMPAIEGPVSLAASSAAVGIAVAWIKTALKRKKNERR